MGQSNELLMRLSSNFLAISIGISRAPAKIALFEASSAAATMASHSVVRAQLNDGVNDEHSVAIGECNPDKRVIIASLGDST